MNSKRKPSGVKQADLDSHGRGESCGSLVGHRLCGTRVGDQGQSALFYFTSAANPKRRVAESMEGSFVTDGERINERKRYLHLYALAKPGRTEGFRESKIANAPTKSPYR